ncbi:MAG: mechanosensitive ion channel domain-containing protein [Bacilli bacterium]
MKKETGWKTYSRGKKVSIIVGIVVWALLAVFCVIVIFSKDIFGANNPFSGVIGDNTTEGFDFGTWWKDNYMKFVSTLFYIVLFLGVSKLIRFLLSLIFVKSKKASTVVKLINSFIKYIAVIALILVILSVWGVDTTTLLASAGILALIIGLGAQPLISDIISGLFIVFDDDYKVGDIVVIDDFRGTVKEIGIRNTKLIDDGGNVKVINNSKIGTVVNMSDNYSLAIVDVSIDYDEDLGKVEKIIVNSFPRLKEKVKGIIGDPIYKGVQEMADSSINMRVVAYVKEENKFQVRRDLNRELFLIFKENNVNIPFNQIVVSKRDEDKK